MSLAARLRDAKPCRCRHPAFAGVDSRILATSWVHPWLRAKLLLWQLVDLSWDRDAIKLVRPRGVAVAREIRALMRAPWLN